jgi:hypothetical protein
LATRKILDDHRRDVCESEICEFGPVLGIIIWTANLLMGPIRSRFGVRVFIGTITDSREEAFGGFGVIDEIGEDISMMVLMSMDTKFEEHV